MKKTKITVLFALVTIMLLLGANAYAAKQTLKTAIINDYDFTGSQISTYAKFCLDNASNRTDTINITYSQYSIESGLNALDNGSVDFLSMIPFDNTLTPYVDYTAKPVATGFLSLLTLNNSGIFFEDYNSMDKSRIAILQNSYYEDELREFAAENRFTYTPVYYNRADDMLKAVKDGECDMALGPASVAPKDMRLAAKLGRFYYYCAVKKGNTDTLSKLNQTLTEYELDSPFNLSENYKINFGIPYQNMMTFTYNDVSAVRAKGVIRVYVSDNYPLSFYKVSDGRYEGMYIDILDQIANRAGLTVEYISDDVNNRDATVDDIMQGKGDILLNVSGTVRDVIMATNPYTTLSFIGVADKKKSPDLNEQITVGITENNMWITTYLSDIHPNWKIRTFHSISAMFYAADNNQIDMALISTLEMQTKTSLISHPGLEIKNVSVDVPVCLGVSTLTCPDAFVNMLNGIIKNLYMPTAEFENKAYTLSHTYVPNFRDMLYANRLLIIVLIGVIAIVIVLLYLRTRYFKKLSRLDRMTELYNGKYFMEASRKILQKNPHKKHLLMSVDAKNFKLVNDRFGTDVGDQILISIAKHLKEKLGAHAIIAKLHGDVFVAFMEDSPFKRSLIEELLQMDIHIHNSSDYTVHIKIGVCPIERYDDKTPMTIYIDKANIAKNNLSALSRNDLGYFTGEAAKKLELENEIEVDMQPALRRGEFIAYYQPKYDLKTEKICGAEALVRWYHKDKGMVSPSLFVPVLERNGFINEVDFAVYEQVLKFIKRRLKDDLPMVKISMNVSRTHLTDENFIPKLVTLFEKYDIPKKYIEMEITESIFSEGDNSAKNLVYELKSNGFNVSMDDFGSGYSSLNLLRIMPIDTLKIDKVFIDDIETSKKSVTIIEEIIDMAKRIDIQTICEGIETKAQRDILCDAGCDMAQGYYYSKPLKESDFEDLLNKEK